MEELLPRACVVCTKDFTPTKYRYKNQATCGDPECVKIYRRNNYIARTKARREGNGAGLNKDGSIKEKYLVRGEITTNSTGYTSLEGGHFD